MFDIVPETYEALVKFSSIIFVPALQLNFIELFISLILSSVISNLLLSKSSVLIIFFDPENYTWFFL